MKFNSKNFMKKLTAGATAAVTIVGSPLTAFASGEESKADDYDFSWIKDGGNGTFDELTKTVKETGASFYLLIMAIGVVGLLVILSYCGLKLAAAGSGKRAEAIEQLLWVFVGGVVIFGGMTWVGYMHTIGSHL